MKNQQEPLLKMYFPLQQDDGWPPVASESVWVSVVRKNLFQIENVPFFASLVAYKDHVQGRLEGNVIYFQRHAKSSGYATVRVIFSTLEKRDGLVHQLEQLGCQIEGAQQWNLIAIGILPGKPFEQTMEIIREGYKQKWWDYEESCLPPKPKRRIWDLFKSSKR
jgi:hypothetical protein